METNEKWLQWAVELQSLAQAGLFYCKDQYELERYERIREIAAEMVSFQSEIPLEKVKDLFCSDVGYQTPKIDTRAAIFKEGKILLVHEANGTWALPGGWVDVNVSVEENTIKEVKEEAGLDVIVKRIIAVQDREKHNLPIYAYKVCKIFMQCEVVGGAFVSNIETTGLTILALTNCPVLQRKKITESRLRCVFGQWGQKRGKLCLIKKGDSAKWISNNNLISSRKSMTANGENLYHVLMIFTEIQPSLSRLTLAILDGLLIWAQERDC